jgi:hypothetical protein
MSTDVADRSYESVEREVKCLPKEDPTEKVPFFNVQMGAEKGATRSAIIPRRASPSANPSTGKQKRKSATSW